MSENDKNLKPATDDKEKNKDATKEAAPTNKKDKKSKEEELVIPIILLSFRVKKSDN